MVETAESVNRHRNEANLLGLRVSAALLILLGCLWAAYAVFSLVLLAMISFRWQQAADISAGFWHKAWPLLLTATIMTALCWLCLRAGAALYIGRRWGAYIAMAFGLLLLIFTGSLVYDWYHPERQIPDEDFTIFVVPFTFSIGLWWCAYLNLPHVKARLRG